MTLVVLSVFKKKQFFMHLCTVLDRNLCLCWFKTCDNFNESFYPETFIFGFKYAQEKRIVFQLLNFIFGQEKLAIYMSRKSKLEQGCKDDVVMAFWSLLKPRILIDFSYYNAMNYLSTFKKPNGVVMMCYVQ